MGVELLRNELRQTVENGVFFDNASMGPVAPCVTEAVNDCMRRRQAMPMRYYQYAGEIFSSCKSLIAELIGAESSEIAFTENVTYGINSAAGALPLKAGDNVILCDREFPSNVYPWMRLEQSKGVSARIVPNCGGGLTTQLLDRYADERTRAVTVSSVEYADGFAADLEAIGAWCRAHGAYFIVDCAQSLGVMPMDVRRFGIDFMAGLSSKWLLGPFSTGFLYVRRELLPKLVPPFVGADSMQTSIDAAQYRFSLKDDASRFEGALPNLPGIAGLRASLLLMKQVGFREIFTAAKEVSGYFAKELHRLGIPLCDCALDEKHRSPIVSFMPPDPERALDVLRQNGISCSLRRGYIRAGIHGYNTADEADAVIAVLKKYPADFR